MPLKHPSVSNGSARSKAFHNSARVLLIVNEIGSVWGDQQGSTSINNGLEQRRDRKQANGAKGVQTASVAYMGVEVRPPVENRKDIGRATSSNLEVADVGEAGH